MTRRLLGYPVIGLLLGAAFGWWFDQPLTEGGLGLVAGLLLALGGRTSRP